MIKEERVCRNYMILEVSCPFTPILNLPTDGSFYQFMLRLHISVPF